MFNKRTALERQLERVTARLRIANAEVATLIAITKAANAKAAAKSKLLDVLMAHMRSDRPSFLTGILRLFKRDHPEDFIAAGLNDDDLSHAHNNDPWKKK